MNRGLSRCRDANNLHHRPWVTRRGEEPPLESGSPVGVTRRAGDLPPRDLVIFNIEQGDGIFQICRKHLPSLVIGRSGRRTMRS